MSAPRDDVRRAIRLVLGAALVTASSAPASAGEAAAPPADRLAGWETMRAPELAEQAGGAASFSIAMGDLLLNRSEVTATVGQTAVTNVNAGAIANNAITGLDGLSTVVFNTGSAVSTAVNYQLNIVVK